MPKDVETELREIVAESMVADSPLAVSLLRVADGIAELRVGLAAVTERIGQVEEARAADWPYSGGVHTLGRYVPGTAT